MSFRSNRSSGRGKGKEPDAEHVYQAALRVAYLTYLMRPKPAEPAPNAASTAAANGNAAYTPGHRHSTSRHLASSFANFSIMDVFKDTVGRDSKSVKFPEKMVKVLEKKCEAVAMGRDAHFTDRDFRAIVARYYGNFAKNKSSFKANRKIEEVVVFFVTDASNHLRKTYPEGDAWKAKIIEHVGWFIKLIRDCLSGLSASQELHDRLQSYSAKLVPPPIALSDPAPASGGSRPTTPQPGGSSSRVADGGVVSGLSQNVADMEMVKTVARLFGKDEATLQEDINALKQVCTEKAAMTDIKTCLRNIHAQEPFPGRREDFDSEAAYEHWRKVELETLTQLMKAMVILNPALAKSTPGEALPSLLSSTSPRPASTSLSSTDDDFVQVGSPVERHTSVKSISSRFSLNFEAVSNAVVQSAEDDGEEPANTPFVFIPTNPKAFYRVLLLRCIEYDLEAMQDLSEEDEVSLGILSNLHLELLAECTVRWRIHAPHKAAAFFRELVDRYEQDHVPVECIMDALRVTQKIFAEWPIDDWTISDRDLLLQSHADLFSIVFSRLTAHAADINRADPTSFYGDSDVLPLLHETGFLDTLDVDIQASLDEIAEQIRVAAMDSFTREARQVYAKGLPSPMDPLFELSKWVNKVAKDLNKRYPGPILEAIDVVPLVLEKIVPMFVAEVQEVSPTLESELNAHPNEFPIIDAFDLFDKIRSVINLFRQACPDVALFFDLAEAFEPYVRHYIEQAGRKTEQWVRGAIEADTFELEEDNMEGHSSSIVDLFSSLRSSFEAVKRLRWPDEYQHAKFMTAMSKTISNAMDQYSRALLDMFMSEMFPHVPEEPQAQGQAAWMTKAQSLMAGEKKAEPFHFDAKSCVKLNNIEAARKLLDNLYSAMDADEVASVMQERASLRSNDRQRYLFSIKIVLAENLFARDNSGARLDPFVTIANQRGERLYKTRTIYGTNNPRWEEAVDISVDSALWIGATIWDRSVVGEHKLVGRTYLKLDPPKYEDCLPQDRWLRLDSNQGGILLRVSMEGEKDDIQFYFGRANISLKRAESDMVRTIVDKMSEFIHQCLSRPVLRSLRKGGGYSVQVTKTLDNLTGNLKSWRIGGGGTSEIPLPKDELPPPPPKQKPADLLTDQEIEEAIGPLFDYFDANFATLASTLTESAKLMVMTKVWKEVLLTIESLLVPPLTGGKTDMTPLADKEVDIVFKWLTSLRSFFNADGSGVPLEALQNQKYHEILSIRLYYDWPTDPLMEECVKMMQTSLRKAPTLRKRTKTVKAHRNIGTIKDRKREKRQRLDPESEHGEIILRILRMRSGTKDFVAGQLQMRERIEEARLNAAAPSSSRGQRRDDARTSQPPPPLPSVPDQYRS